MLNTAISSSPSSRPVNPSYSTQQAAPTSSLAAAISMVSCSHKSGEPKVPSLRQTTEETKEKYVLSKDFLGSWEKETLAKEKTRPTTGSLPCQKTYASALHKLGLRGAMNKDQELRKEYEANQKWLQEKAEEKKKIESGK